jgi:hypothetical protein
MRLLALSSARKSLWNCGNICRNAGVTTATDSGSDLFKEAAGRARFATEQQIM